MDSSVSSSFLLAGSLLERVLARALSPSIMRLLAPLLALFVLAFVWHLWKRANGTALGRAVRWWCVTTVCAVLVGWAVYLAAAPPDDPMDAAAARIVAQESVGKIVYPIPLAAAGAVALTVSALVAAGGWRRARTSERERATLSRELREVRARWRLPALIGGVAVAGFVGTACAALAGSAMVAPQVPSLAQPELGRGSLWVGTAAGASRLVLDGDRTSWQAFRRPWVPLPSSRVTAIAAGPPGEVWLATHGGLVQFRTSGTGLKWQAMTVENAGLPYPTVLGVAVDAQGTAWAATGAGAASVQPDGSGRAFTTKNAPLLHQILDAAYVDRDGRVWFGGAGGVNVYQPAAGGRDGTWPVGFTRESSGGTLPDDLVYSIVGDGMGRIWFGTRSGAAVLQPDANAFALGAYDPSRWQTFTSANSTLPNDQVHTILIDGQERIWFGTENGIAVLDESRPSGSAGQWTIFAAGSQSPAAPNLPHPWVQALASSPDGRIWAGTRSGLAVFDPSRPNDGWNTYRAHSVRFWAGHLWPAFWRDHILSDDVTALAWVR
jgi:ligand-binding sensor domain-containing protein